MKQKRLILQPITDFLYRPLGSRHRKSEAQKQKNNIATIVCACLLGLAISAMSAFAAAKKHYHYPKQTSPSGEYTRVVDNPDPNKSLTYPAPSGYEDRELLPETWSYVRTSLGSPECAWGSRDSKFNASHGGTWWFSQVVGQDHTSSETHIADMRNTASDASLVDNYFSAAPSNFLSLDPTVGVGRLYCSAFDIVLTSVPVQSAPQIGGPNPAFQSYVTNLRNAGIVSWHRWQGESGSLENEMHSIDPASPYIKQSLQSQITNTHFGFMVEEQGGSAYSHDFGYSSDPSEQDNTWAAWKTAVRNRQKLTSIILSNHTGLTPNLDATPLPAL